MIISNPPIGDRLDRIVAKQFKDISRSTLQKHIKAGLITVNDAAVTKHYALREGDVINVDDSVLKETAAFILQANKKVRFEVLEESDTYIVINKPAGLIVHPGSAHYENDTLVSGLLARYPEIVEIGDDSMRPGIVHRLDKDVSGIMVIARTPEMFEHLKSQFQQRTVIKHYITLVHGVMSQAAGEIDLSISRSQRDRTRMAAHPDGSGKPARTEYEVIEQFQHYALLRVQIYTGRTHQIRVHLNAIDNHVVGDEVYRPKKFHSRSDLQRLFLHAERLIFKDLDGVEQEFYSPLPSKLQGLVDELYKNK